MNIGFKLLILGSGLLLLSAVTVLTQVPDPTPPPRRPGGPGDFPPGGAGGRGRPGGPGAGGMMGQERKVLKQFDQNRDGRLDAAERKAARDFLEKSNAGGRGPRGFGGPPGGPPRGFGGPGGENQEPAQPGMKVSPAEVKTFPNVPLYDPHTLRTYFLEFENEDWEKELMAFNNTDVELYAKLIIDGKTLRDVGVHIRGMSSSMVPVGKKHSLNLDLDLVHQEQSVGGYRTLNLLNSHSDPSFLRSVLYSEVAKNYIPTPRANFVRLVINGESWGVFINAQQFNKDFLRDTFQTTKGARWKAPGSPGGRANLSYLGDDPETYKRIYTIKTKDDPKAWASLINLCKVLNTTPPDQLEAALSPLLDIDGALKFLALENVLINNDGYWIRTSDYSLYQDSNGKFHIIPHDMNEGFARPGGPGFGGGPGGARGRRFGGPGGPGGPRGFEEGPNSDRVPPPFEGGAPEEPGPRDRLAEPGGSGERGRGGPAGMPAVDGVKLDPLIAAKDENKPLISKLLAVPTLRTRYLSYVRDIAENWLDWNKLGPIAERYHELIAAEVKVDTRKLSTWEAFESSLVKDGDARGFGPMGGGSIGLKNFADQRRAYLLALPEIKQTGK